MAKTNITKKETQKLRAAVDSYVAAQKNNTFNYRQVSHAIGASDPLHQRAVALYLSELAFDDKILEVAPGKYKTQPRAVQATGTFSRRSNGKNSVIMDDGEEIFVAERNSMHALNGDRVAVSIAAHVKGQEDEAIVSEIIEPAEQSFIGTLKVDKNVAVLQTDSKFLASDIIIPRKALKGGKDGDKAIVTITDWPEDSKNPRGKVLDILGQSGDNQAEQNAILAEFKLPYRYPEAVEKAADKIGAGITPEEVAKRIDMRDVTTFTIDPRDAKDFDDALSFRKLKNGNYEVGVHIADVTHYVRPDSIIDKEAAERATSVYLVDRVVPMLPEHLSNGICSLRPNEDKLTFSVIFEIEPNGKIVDTKIARTVTRSDRRFTYEEAQQIIETGKGDYKDEILTLDRLAKIYRKERYDSGSVDFDRVEVRFETDDAGHPLSVYFKESKDANKLIEEFMLLANKAVASEIGIVPKKKKAKAFVYRVHDKPDAERLASLADMARNFGYKVKTDGSPKVINRSINKLLQDIKGKGEENFLATLALRAMAKAIYSTKNIGHYGLGFDHYTHFTSPIRRYPDMMVHRLLERYLKGGRSVSVEKLEEDCKHSSDQEQLAANAERASVKYKQVEYMGDHLGEVYEGVITGVTEWGLFVELVENKCEGLVPVRDLADDYYDLDAKNYTLVGRTHNNKYRLGDKVRVQVARADLPKKQLDFVIVDEKNPPRTLDSLTRPKSKARPQQSSKVGNRKGKGARSRRQR